MSKEMQEFLKTQFDKLLLTFLFLTVFFSVIIMVHNHIEPSVVSWGRETAAGFSGALLGLITGMKVGMAIAATKGESNDKS